MPHDLDQFMHMSLCLSDVLSDIGVNEDMVIRTRRAWLLRESLTTVCHRARRIKKTDYIFGSLTEGTTTTFLRSDCDYLMFSDDDEVFSDIKNCREWQINRVMIDDDSSPPGYCYLGLVFGNNPKQNPKEALIPHITSIPVFCKSDDGEEYELHGPAFHSKGKTTYNDQDYVTADFCKTFPNGAKKWLFECVYKWPSKEMKLFAEQNGCFIVPVGSKRSKTEAYEYRISTSLAERAIIFSLNITQLRCCILLKMIMKTFFSSDEEDCVISSYICKTVVFHCIKHTPVNLWQDLKLLNCLTLCLSVLQYCVLTDNCPHFIMHSTNLLLGRITPQFRSHFLEKIGFISLSCGHCLENVLYEYLGLRLEIKLNKTTQSLPVRSSMRERVGVLLRNTGKYIQDFYLLTLFDVKYENEDVALPFLYSCVSALMKIHKLGSKLERFACKLLAEELSSTVGSLLASSNIKSSKPISKTALKWFDLSLDTDVSSNRLKMASVLYCAGDINAALSIINDVERRYDLNAVEPVCRCTLQSSTPARDGFDIAAARYNENAFKYVVAYCVNFLRCERKCMPKELQLEMYRTTAAEQHLLHLKNQWLELAFIDSLTYLFFLKYKIYGRLGRQEKQRQALDDLIRAIRYEPNLGHRETGLNLVGQIMVEKGKLFEALYFFLASYRLQPELNAAKIHICTSITKLLKQKKGL